VENVWSIKEVFARLGMHPVKEQRDELVYKCPLVEHTADGKSPRTYAVESKGVWWCHKCGEGGGIIDLVVATKGLSRQDAAKWLNDELGDVPSAVRTPKLPEEPPVTLEEYKAHVAKMRKQEAQWAEFLWYYETDAGGRTESSLALIYCAERMIGNDTIKRYGLGWNVTNGDDAYTMRLAGRGDRVMIPQRNAAGDTLGFQGRALYLDLEPKYLYSESSRCYRQGEIVFGMDIAKKKIGRRYDFVVIVEGPFDVLTADTWFEDVPVVSTGLHLSDAKAAVISMYAKKAVLAFDPDNAGMNAVPKAKQSLERYGVKVAVDDASELRGYKDFNEYVCKITGRGDLNSKVAGVRTYFYEHFDRLLFL